MARTLNTDSELRTPNCELRTYCRYCPVGAWFSLRMKLSFDNQDLPPEWHWHNEPEEWSITNGCLVIQTELTDFWQKTHYGFEKDDGHFLYCELKGDAVLRSKLTMLPQHQYDQAGLMVRVNQDCWIKASLEFENPTLSRLGSVVTNFGYSDWSTQDCSPAIHELDLRITRTGPDYLIEFNKDGVWSQLRMTHLHSEETTVQCGIYACSPVAIGFAPEFHFVEIDERLAE